MDPYSKVKRGGCLKSSSDAVYTPEPKSKENKDPLIFPEFEWDEKHSITDEFGYPLWAQDPDAGRLGHGQAEKSQTKWPPITDQGKLNRDRSNTQPYASDVSDDDDGDDSE